MCDHRLAGGPLVCDRDTAHDAPKGCTYSASAGPDNDSGHVHATGDEQ
jgi:hypothetical protein